MPAWQNRQPSVQPRAISTDARSNTASAYGTGASDGNGYLSRSGTIARFTRAGARGSSGAPTTIIPVSASSSVAYSAGTYTGYAAASSASASRRVRTPARISARSAAHVLHSPASSSSPSPMNAASMNGATGSGCDATEPPTRTSGASSARSAARSAMPPSSSNVSMLVNVSSYCSEIPTTSNPASGVWLSSDTSGTPCARSSASMSSHGANARSHQMSASLLSSE